MPRVHYTTHITIGIALKPFLALPQVAMPLGIAKDQAKELLLMLSNGSVGVITTRWNAGEVS